MSIMSDKSNVFREHLFTQQLVLNILHCISITCINHSDMFFPIKRLIDYQSHKYEHLYYTQRNISYQMT